MPGPYRLIISVNLDRHTILVVGGGAVAERKTATLLRCGARVKLVSPDATSGLMALAKNKEIIWEERAVSDEDFAQHKFAVAATRNTDAVAVAMRARDACCLVDVCSDGSEGDFAICAQFEKDGCYVGVSSGGVDPSKASSLKRDIMALSRADPDGGAGLSAAPVRVLTRNSPLALMQADMWIDAMAGIGVTAVKKEVASHGDRDRISDLSKFGFGAFVKALEDELINGVGDCAVHSLKDMPSQIPENCVLAAVLKRGSIYDALITRDGSGLDSIPSGGRVGTSSVRRRAQILNVRPDVECVPCRGNVDTRLAKLRKGEVDALVLAEAGLERLGRKPEFAVRLPFITSAGQGAVAVEVRAGSPLEGILRPLNHTPTWYEVTAERAFLANMGLGCVCPIGVRGVYLDGELELTADVFSVAAADHAPHRGADRVTSRVWGSVNSEREARLLASRLWDDLRDDPLIQSIKVQFGGVEL
jgi:hydroxymethylbilane synthase